MEVITTSLFASGEIEGISAISIRVPVAGALPANWQPGTELLLRGPLGHGFSLPKQARRIALVALASNPGRLLPLLAAGIRQGAEITLLREGNTGDLPVAIEEQTLDQIPKAIQWADYVAMDIGSERMEEIETIFPKRLAAALEAEILITAPMPCGGMAKCGICTVRTTQGQRLACEDGPVFKLNDLL